MKRAVTKLVSLLLVAAMFFTIVPVEAFAWGKMTHVFTANDVLADTQAYRTTVDFENENDYDKCGYCTMVVDLGYDFLLCGIPVGTGITHLHKNYEPKVKGGADNG